MVQRLSAAVALIEHPETASAHSGSVGIARSTNKNDNACVSRRHVPSGAITQGSQSDVRCNIAIDGQSATERRANWPNARRWAMQVRVQHEFSPWSLISALCPRRSTLPRLPCVNRSCIYRDSHKHINRVVVCCLLSVVCCLLSLCLLSVVLVSVVLVSVVLASLCPCVLVSLCLL